MRAKIPRMDDPLGAYWHQRKNLRDRVGIYFDYVTIHADDWDTLSDYRTTIPSGVYPGKVWRSGKYLCWYGPDRNGRCRICRVRALVHGAGTNLTYRPGKAK